MNILIFKTSALWSTSLYKSSMSLSSISMISLGAGLKELTTGLEFSVGIKMAIEDLLFMLIL